MEAVCVMMDVKPTMVPDPMLAGKKIADYWESSKVWGWSKDFME